MSRPCATWITRIFVVAGLSFFLPSLSNAQSSSPDVISQQDLHTPGNLGFMAAMASQCIISAYWSGDPAAQWACWDSLHDPGQWVGIYSFALTSTITQDALNDWWRNGPTDAWGRPTAGQLGMVVGSLANHFASKAWASPGRIGLGVDLSEHWYWIKQRTLLRNQLALNWLAIREAKTPQEKQALEKKRAELKKAHQEAWLRCVSYRKPMLKHLGEMTLEAFKTSPDELRQLGISTIQMLMTVGVLHLVQEKWGLDPLQLALRGAKGVETRLGLIRQINQWVKETMPVEKISGVSFSKNLTGIGSKAVLDEVKISSGAGLSLISMKSWLGAFMGSAYSGVLFLTLNKYLEGMTDTLGRTTFLHKNLDEPLQKVRLLSDELVHGLIDDEKAEKMIREIDVGLEQYHLVWEEYRQNLILREFNEHKHGWEESLAKHKIEIYKTKNYLHWLAKGANVQDPRFLDNGHAKGGLPWHEDVANQGAFTKEKALYEDMLRDVRRQGEAREYRNQMYVPAAWQVPDDKKDELYLDLEPTVVKFLVEKQRELEREDEYSLRLFAKALAPLLQKAYFGQTPPWYVKLNEMLVKSEYKISGQSPFNLRRSDQAELERLKSFFVALFQKYPKDKIAQLLFQASSQRNDEGRGLQKVLEMLTEEKPSIDLNLSPSSNVALVFARHFKSVISDDQALDGKMAGILSQKPIDMPSKSVKASDLIAVPLGAPAGFKGFVDSDEKTAFSH